MQVPVFGDVIKVKNLKKRLEELDDDKYLLSDKNGNLLICTLEKFENGNMKNLKIEKCINFFYEETISLERYRQMIKREKYTEE